MRTVRNTNTRHTQTIRGTKLTSGRKETSVSVCWKFQLTPQQVLTIQKKSLRNDYRIKREWECLLLGLLPQTQSVHQGGYRTIQGDTKEMRTTAESFFLATSAEKGYEKEPDKSTWKCDQETIICAHCHKGKAAKPNLLGWRSNMKKRKYFFHTMQNWIMTLVTGCCEDQNYKRIPKRVSQILGGLTHLQLLNTMTQMPVKNSLNHSLLSTELVISQRNCAMLALSLHPLPHSLLLEWAAQLVGPLLRVTITA